MVTAHRLGMFRTVAGLYGSRRLTVLAYHRVADPDAPAFVGFRGNVSATPPEFAEQLRWAAERFSVVTLGDVADAAGGHPLPRRPLLITFDDGYRDNYEVAGPILARHGLTATVLLATDLVGNRRPPWWDLAAWCFGAAVRAEAELPLLGHQEWSDPHRQSVAWIRAAKRLPDAEMRRAVDHLPDALGVAADDEPFRRLMLDWEQVAAMAAGEWTIGAHTRSHPILTRVRPDRVAEEVVGSRDRVAEAVGSPPRAFAYPNGLSADFDSGVRAAVADAGFEVAFTLLPGPSRWAELTEDPLGVRRVYIHHGDGISRFAAKVSGVSRLSGAAR